MSLRRVIGRDLGDPEREVRAQGEGEEEVAEPVRPLEKLGALRFGPMQAPELPLRTPCERSGPVQVRRGRGSGGEHKGAQGLDGLGVLVDVGFQATNVASLDTTRGRSLTRRCGELALGEEELVLETSDERTDVRQRVGELRFDDAEAGREFVEGAVGLDAQRVLRYPRATDETGLAAIPSAGVEPRSARASGRQGSSSSGELSPCTGQYEIRRTSLCLAS